MISTRAHRWRRRLARALLLAAALLTQGCRAPRPVAPAATPAQIDTPGPAVPATPEPPAEARGAAVPWVEYEAESASTNGLALEATRAFGQIAAEASGRRAVRLEQTGQYVRFSAARAANALVVRYVIPDAPAGGGITATLSLYVDGVPRQKLSLTSRYAWSYGGESETLNDPSAGGAHHFFDEARALVGDIPAGASVALQKDADDQAAFYVLDLVDLEQVAPPADMPAGFLSIGDCGATPDDASDDGPAIQTCVERAMRQGRGLWIPSGRFESASPTADRQGIALAGLELRGAGMWHSVIHGAFARFHCTGDGCRFADFAILGETTRRDDSVPENGFNGGAGHGSRMERVWVEHTKVGWWVGEGARNPTEGLVITGSRFRNLFADGVNLCNGASGALVEQSHFRNTGDDAIASWAPAAEGGVNTGNVFRHNTVQVPWRANCFAIYGGRDNRIEDSLCADVVTYPGVLIAQDFGSHPFSGTTTVRRTRLVRAGGPMWRQQHGALKIQATKGPVVGLVVEDIEIDSPTYAGIQIQGPGAVSAASFERVSVDRPGTWGVYITNKGAATFGAVVVREPGREGLFAVPEGDFVITRGAGNSGW